jgi:predicted RNA-binding protein with PUA-like domain
MKRATKYWLVKSEPEAFSIDDLTASPHQTTCWDGVRNYQARNFMRDGMKLDDCVLFYHSSVEPPCVVGVAKVVREAYPDPTAWDKRDQHFDAKASPENPIWQMIDLKLVEKFTRSIPLDELRGVPTLKNMELLRRGSRLSVQPVTKTEFDAILKLAHRKR